MKNLPSRFFSLLFLAMVVATAGCVPESSQAETFKEGKDYVTISPPIAPLGDSDKVEVVEMFWYGCPHCYTLEPTIEKYLQSKPDYVDFKRMPATLSPRWRFHAKLFYVGQMLDPEGKKKVHMKIFEALQKQRRQINNEQSMERFFTSLGFDSEQIGNALNSMEMQAMMQRADEVGSMSRADSVPTIIINGKYRTSPSMVGNEEQLLKVINYLTQREAKK